MKNITSYLYRNKIECQIFEPATHSRRSVTVYAKNLRAYRGVSNRFLIEVKNQDQKPINIASRTVRMHILDEVRNTAFITKIASTYNAAKGQALVILDENDLLDLDQSFYNYTISVVDGEGNDEIAYADDHYGVRNNLEILAGHYPEFQPSTQLEFDTVTGLTSGTGTGREVYRASRYHTAQFYLDGYTGSIQVEGTMDQVPNLNNANYFVIKTLSYSGVTGVRYTSWQGNFSAIRFRTVPTNGTVARVLYRE